MTGGIPAELAVGEAGGDDWTLEQSCMELSVAEVDGDEGREGMLEVIELR